MLLQLVLISLYQLSDGQKRAVYIYRFLTAGSIDGLSISARLFSRIS